MRSDSEIEQDARDELKWESRINGSEIEVFVKNGYVILSGVVDAYQKKTDAEVAAIRVEGVTGIDNDIRVEISDKKTDNEIEEAVLDAVKWNSSVDERKISVKSRNGWVTFEGEVTWEYQKSRISNLAKSLTSVAGVFNLIEVISPFPITKDIKEKIDAALKRNYHLSSNTINVEVSGNKVILRGQVRSLHEKNDAEAAAWSAPGIGQVDNKLVVGKREDIKAQKNNLE